jgi:hypothetical protein
MEIGEAENESRRSSVEEFVDIVVKRKRREQSVAESGL